VIDLQKGITSVPTELPVDAVVGKAAELAAAFRRQNLPVVLVNVTGRSPGRTDVTWGGLASMPPEWTDIVDELDPQPGDHRITKRRRSAFHVVLATDAMTDLDTEAHRSSVERIFPRIGETAVTAEILAMVEAT
jgi:isochorismate hydrolase